MNTFLLRLGFILAACSFTSCATTQISDRPVPASEPGAAILLQKARQTHGQAAFQKIRRITVSYDGQWAKIGPRLQPILADTRFRRRSVETLDLIERCISQIHNGPAGQKIVIRQPGKIRLSYHGMPSDDPEKKRAAALVADAYTMFLLGPFYFNRPGVTLALAGTTTVDQAPCDNLLAVLRPGFGFAAEDRVILSIDRATKRLRRVRMTLNGLDSTQGAEVDVTFRDFRTIAGVLWPTDFDERIRAPLRLHAHHWRLVDLQVNADISSAKKRPNAGR